jgi:peptidoglycan-associated lipoprotein
MKHIPSFFALIIMALLLTGCPPRPAEPDPSMTAVGGGAGAGGAGSGDWVSPGALSGEGLEGLRSRDGMGSFADGNQIRNLLPSVYFDFDQYAIRPGDRTALQTAAEHMRNNPSDRLLLEGHCDWRGTTEYNMVLGERRANSAMQYLLNLGVPAERMETLSKGDLEAVTEASEAQMAQDRRADLVIVR